MLVLGKVRHIFKTLNISAMMILFLTSSFATIEQKNLKLNYKKREIIFEEISLEDKEIIKDDNYSLDGQHFYVNYSLGTLLKKIDEINNIEIMDNEFNLYYGYTRKNKGFMDSPNHDTKYIWSNLGPDKNGIYNEEEDYKGIFYSNKIISKNDESVEIVNQNIIDHYDEYKDCGWGGGSSSQSGFYFSNLNVKASIENLTLKLDLYVNKDFKGKLNKSKIGKIERIKVFGFDKNVEYEEFNFNSLELITEVDSGIEYHYTEIDLNEYILKNKTISSIEFVNSEFVLRYSIEFKEQSSILLSPKYSTRNFRTDEGPGDFDNSSGYNEFPEWEGIKYNETNIHEYNKWINIVTTKQIVDYYDEYKDHGWGFGDWSNNGYHLGKIKIFAIVNTNNILTIKIFDNSTIIWTGIDEKCSEILDLKLRISYE